MLGQASTLCVLLARGCCWQGGHVISYYPDINTVLLFARLCCFLALQPIRPIQVNMADATAGLAQRAFRCGKLCFMGNCLTNVSSLFLGGLKHLAVAMMAADCGMFSRFHYSLPAVTVLVSAGLFRQSRVWDFCTKTF